MTTLKKKEAERLKRKGNEAFIAGKYQEAVDAYTQALDAEFDKSLLLNRSHAYLKLGKWGYAYVDANETLRHYPNDVKGLVRRAQARMELGFERGAVTDLEKAKELSPYDDTIPELLERAKSKVDEAEAFRQKFIEMDEDERREVLKRMDVDLD